MMRWQRAWHIRTRHTLGQSGWVGDKFPIKKKNKQKRTALDRWLTLWFWGSQQKAGAKVNGRNGALEASAENDWRWKRQSNRKHVTEKKHRDWGRNSDGKRKRKKTSASSREVERRKKKHLHRHILTNKIQNSKAWSWKGRAQPVTPFPHDVCYLLPDCITKPFLPATGDEVMRSARETHTARLDRWMETIKYSIPAAVRFALACLSVARAAWLHDTRGEKVEHYSHKTWTWKWAWFVFVIV